MNVIDSRITEFHNDTDKESVTSIGQVIPISDPLNSIGANTDPVYWICASLIQIHTNTLLGAQNLHQHPASCASQSVCHVWMLDCSSTETNYPVKWHSSVTVRAEVAAYNATIWCQSVWERGRHRERGERQSLHQQTLRDASRVDEAMRSIRHNHCRHTVIDEHVAWGLPLDSLNHTSQFQPNQSGSVRPLNSKCFYLPAIQPAIGAGECLYLYFWAPL